jgi:hypothetical protein
MWPLESAPTLTRMALPLAAATSLAACDRPPVAPDSSAWRGSISALSPGIVAENLGTLPGDVKSEATFVTGGGTVYGRSYAEGGETPRFFRWTKNAGLTEVSAIPTPPAPPLPSLAPSPPFARAVVTAANAKGEATGALCFDDCETLPDDPTAVSLTHAFRFSAGAGAQDLDPRPRDPFGDSNQSRGWSINRWGHVAGTYWGEPGTEPRPFIWTPLDSFQLFDVLLPGDLGDTRVNDVDQVIGTYGTAESAPCAFVWRRDLGRRDLDSPLGSCIDGDGRETRALAQQRRGRLVVGWAWVRVGGRSERHAALWRVPALDRAADPKVDASPVPRSSKISLAETGGRYFQLYRVTQSTPAGPYTELVDWGDGSTSRRRRAGTNVLAYQEHVYTRTGKYWVRVYVQDATGRWGVDERRLTVVP